MSHTFAIGEVPGKFVFMNLSRNFIWQHIQFVVFTFNWIACVLPLVHGLSSVNFCIVLQLSFGPIGWLMISEIFPLRTRGRGLSIAVLVNFGANALVTFAFSPLKVRI